MGWQDAPLVQPDNKPESAQPAWMSAPVVANGGAQSPAPQQQIPPTRGKGGVMETADAAIRGAADAGTLGFADEITAGLNSILPLDAINNKNITSVWSGKSLSDAYHQNLNAERAVDSYDAQHHGAARLAGQVAGGVAVGGEGLAKNLAQGAAYGFGSGQGGIKNRAESAVVGTAGAGAGYGIGKVIGKVISPAITPQAKALMNEGVSLTPGQTAGGWLKGVEDKATSILGVGDVIKSGQRDAVESFNKVAVNRVLKPIGETLPKSVNAGYDAIQHAGDALSRKYQSLLPKLTVKLDTEFTDNVAHLKDLASNMPESRVQQFNKILQQHVLDKFSQTGFMSGETMKDSESALGGLIRKYAGSNDGDQRLLGDALKELQDQLRQLTVRSNPGKASLLKKLNEGWANLTRVERAAAGAKDGIFTPAQLQTASRVMDSSVRKRASARGSALMQDLATNARAVLPSTVPDSGTAGRIILGGLGLGGLGLVGEGYKDKSSALGGLGLAALATSAAYSPAGRNALATIIAKRPELAPTLASYISRVGTPVGAALANPSFKRAP